MPAALPPSVIGVTASFTPQLLLRPLLEAAPEGTEVVVADFNQVHQTLMDVGSAFGGREPDRLVVAWRIEDIFARSLTSWVLTPGDLGGLPDDVRQLGALVAQTATHTGRPVVVTVPPCPVLPWLDPLDTRTSIRLTVLHGQLVEAFVDGLGDAPVTLVDLSAAVRQHGVERAYDLRNDLMYHQPFTGGFARTLGALLGEALASVGRAVPKVLAVDADNTLWGGVLGEDGADGITVGDSFPGNAYRALQQGLVYQASNGALIALVSKNNSSDVDEVFERRGHDLALRAEHIAARRVDWNSKADNLESIADELNLGLDSFVFLDDNDVELDEVRQRQPAVRLVKVTDEPAEVAQLTAGLSEFRFARVTREDRSRTAMVQREAERNLAASAAPSHEEFLASLGLVMRIFTPAGTQLGRVTQLINKTNQFNLTTVRRDEGEVVKLAGSARHRLYAADVSDRFGDYGLVAVAVVDSLTNSWEIDTLLMSCRVLRRGLEDAIVQCIADDAHAAGATTLRGSYRPSAKNGQVATFYSERGFRATGEGQFEAELPLALAPLHVTVRRDA